MERLLATHFNLLAAIVALFMFGGMFALLEIGYRIGRRRRLAEGKDIAGLGTLEGGVFGLMGLLLAFSFSGAAGRFDDRRNMIVEEANDIGTAWLRLDLMPIESQPAIKDSFRSYVDSRIAAYRVLPDYDAALGFIKRGEDLQGVIWKQAVAGTLGGWPPASSLLLPALNAMFDITTTRKFATRAHPPLLLYCLLAVLVLAGSMLAGYGMSGSPKRPWTHSIPFVLMVSLTIWVILDLEYPRLGFIRVDTFDQAIVDVRTSMK